MRGVPHARREQLVDALARGESISAAARATGYHRVYVSRKWNAKDGQLQAEVERRKREIKAAEPGAEVRGEEPAPKVVVDDDMLERLLKLGLGVLASVARLEAASSRDRVSASKALVDYVQKQRRAQAASSSSAPVASQAPPAPMSRDEVASILKLA